jgi:uncharacterized protein YjbJ (UPF0337 family)
MINSTGGSADWNDQKAKLKEKFAILTGNDLLFEEGKKEQMLKKLQLILGKSKEELANLISKL